VARPNIIGLWIARRPMSCIPISLDRYGRTVAACSVAGADIAEWVVRDGLALDWPRYSKGRYGDAQRDAERAGRGIWRAATLSRGYIVRTSGRAVDPLTVRMMLVFIPEVMSG